MSDLKRTPLHAFHLKHGARMVPFNGWELPVQYAGILVEHRAVRERVGLFDVSHMGEILVQGNDAAKLLDYLLTNSIEGLRPGRAVYTVMCSHQGTIIDDLIVYCLAQDRFFLCVNAGNTESDLDWIIANKGRFDCEIIPLSTAYGQIAVQGPRSHAVIDQLLPGLALKRFHCFEAELNGCAIFVSRTGYTGEDGYEIYCSAPRTVTLAEDILRVASDYGIELCGLGSRDSLRLEAGFPLYGHEIDGTISPLEAGLDWALKFDKATPFIGQQTMQEQKRVGLRRKLIYFRLNDRRIARQGTSVFQNERVVGTVCSGAFSPMLNGAIGSALIEADALECDAPLLVELRGSKIRLERATPPLHK